MNVLRVRSLRIQLRPVSIEQLAVYIYFLPQVYFYLNCILSTLEWSISSSALYIFYIILSAFIYSRTIRTHSKYFASCVILFVLIVVFSLLMSPNILKYLIPSDTGYGHVFNSIVIYMPVFFAASTVKDKEALLKTALNVSRITLILVVFAFVLRIVIYNLGSLSIDYMTFAYYSLPSIFICFYEGLRKKHFSLILAILSSLIILVGGCRGALMTLLAFFLLYFLFVSQNKKSSVKFFIILLLVVLIIIAYFYMNSIMSAISHSLERVGYTSRILSTLTGGKYYDTNAFLDVGGRASFWEVSSLHISVFGMHGIFGDRLILNDSYTHNIVLELMIDYGAFLGIVLFIILSIMSIKALVWSRRMDNSCVMWCISALSIFFVKMMVSASYLTSIDFWFYFGLILWVINQKKAKKISDTLDNRRLSIGQR